MRTTSTIRGPLGMIERLAHALQHSGYLVGLLPDEPDPATGRKFEATCSTAVVLDGESTTIQSHVYSTGQTTTWNEIEIPSKPIEIPSKLKARRGRPPKHSAPASTPQDNSDVKESPPAPPDDDMPF